jgi:acyl-CoA thioester hydrolase
MTTDNNVFALQMKVRDYECDSGNGVNNAIFLNYLEFARFEFLRQELKWDIPALTKQDIGFVLVNMNIDFRRSLEAGDEFIVETVMERESKRKFLFTQNIYLLPERKIVLNGKIIATVINTKTLRAEVPDSLETLLGERFAVPSKIITV